MPVRYAHTNLVARDWQRLARFYEEVFGCQPVLPERDLDGDWLARGTGVRGVHLRGAHLRLPGHGDTGPTLEVFTYEPLIDAPAPLPNRTGLGHIAFAVEDVSATADAVVDAGGSLLGEVVTESIPGRGALTFVYAADPEGNVVELQRWT
jgi:catechol 2,3-dioxygenase-like lactoylglutathione lyase family enzyme